MRLALGAQAKAGFNSARRTLAQLAPRGGAQNGSSLSKNNDNKRLNGLGDYFEKHGMGIVEFKHSSGVQVNLKSLNRGMNTFINNDRAGLAIELLESMEERWKIKPDIYSYASALKAYNKLSRVDEAIQLFDRLDALGIKKDAVMCNTMMNILGKSGKWRQALSLFRQLGAAADNYSRQTILTTLYQCNEKALLMQLKAEFANENQEINDNVATGNDRAVSSASFIDFSELHRTAVRSGDYGPAVEKVSAWIALKDVHLLRSNGALTEIFKLLGSAGRSDVVQNVLNVVKDRGLSLNTRNANAAMNAFIRSNAPSAACDLFESFETRWGLTPDAHSYGLAIRAYHLTERGAEAIALFERLSESIKCSVVVCNHIMVVLAELGQWRRAYAVFRSLGQAADKVSQQVILSAMEQACQPRIKQSLEVEFAGQNKKIDLSTDTKSALDFNELLREAQNRQDFAVAVKTVMSWVDAGNLTPSGLTWCFQIYGHANRGDLVQQLLQTADSLGFVLNTVHCNAAMHAFLRCDQNASALTVLEVMEARWGAVPDAGTYISAFRAHSNLGQWEEALALFERLGDQSEGTLYRNPAIYCAIIEVLTNAKQWRKAVSAYQDARHLGLVDKDKTISKVMFNALRTAGQTELLRALKQELAAEHTHHDAEKGIISSSQNRKEVNRLQTSNVASDAGSLMGLSATLEKVITASDSGAAPGGVGSEEAERLSLALFRELLQRPGGASTLVQFLGMVEQTDLIGKVLDAVEARSLLDDRLSSASAHLVNTYNTAILACGNAGQADLAFQYYRRMLKNGVPRTRNTYECLMRISAAFKGEEDMLYVKKQAAVDGITISSYYHF